MTIEYSIGLNGTVKKDKTRIVSSSIYDKLVESCLMNVVNEMTHPKMVHPKRVLDGPSSDESSH